MFASRNRRCFRSKWRRCSAQACAPATCAAWRRSTRSACCSTTTRYSLWTTSTTRSSSTPTRARSVNCPHSSSSTWWTPTARFSSTRQTSRQFRQVPSPTIQLCSPSDPLITCPSTTRSRWPTTVHPCTTQGMKVSFSRLANGFSLKNSKYHILCLNTWSFTVSRANTFWFRFENFVQCTPKFQQM